MSYRFHCDWCGAVLYDADMAVMPVTIKRAGARRWEADEVRPTRHFCVPPKADNDRLGLPDEDVDYRESCYGKAIMMMTGKGLEAPDMGFEWRLMPTSAATPLQFAERDLRQARNGRERMEAERRQEQAIIDGPGGIGVLNLPEGIRHRLQRAFRKGNDTLTLAGLQDLAVRNRIVCIDEIGPSREAVIREALRQHGGDGSEVEKPDVA